MKNGTIDPIISRERLQDSMKTSDISSPAITTMFTRILYDYYHQFGRSFPWRQTSDPYAILVSEVMLQQTQTERVIYKFKEFMGRFPVIDMLAAASIEELLVVWQGMGYNKRVLYLREAAKCIVRGHGGRVPDDPALLVRLPGLGPSTAASVAAFAFNRPVAFIETNIRSVVIFYFFPEAETVTDREILPWVTTLLDRENPRKWYSAIMDYGVMLKGKFPHVTKRSAHYVRQSPFAGSDRQLRGVLLKLFLEEKSQGKHDLLARLNIPAKRISHVLDGLVKDGFLCCHGDRYVISGEEA